MTHTKYRQSGFTIVELLIVIVVIGILAAITIVAYNGIQERARDSQRQQDLSSIKKAMLMQYVDTGEWIRSGATCTSNATGFFSQAGTSATGSNYGTKSMTQCLKEAGYTSTTFTDPSGLTSCAGSPCHVYMKFESGPTNDRAVCVYARLENPPAAYTDDCASGYASSFGMNYMVRVN